MPAEIEKYVLPVAKAVSITEKWYNLEPDLQRFKIYLHSKVMKRLRSEKLEDVLRSTNQQQLYDIIKEIAAQFLAQKRLG